MLWTAHGIKVWPSDIPFSLRYVYFQGRPCPAMPRLSYILSPESFRSLTDELTNIEFNLYPLALSTTRVVRRIPLKPVGHTPEEIAHLRKSSDGLLYFEPYDIYRENIQSYPGLISTLAICARLDGFGKCSPNRRGHYSCVLYDVSTFWMAFRMLYSFTGCTRILHDLFLFLGPWHIYMYSYVVVWSQFRSSYLTTAFFLLFPTQNLFFRPKLVTSSTFFT